MLYWRQLAFVICLTLCGCGSDPTEPENRVPDYGMASAILEDGRVVGLYLADFRGLGSFVPQPFVRSVAVIDVTTGEYASPTGPMQYVGGVSSSSGFALVKVSLFGQSYRWRPGEIEEEIPGVAGYIMSPMAVNGGGLVMGFLWPAAGGASVAFVWSGGSIDTLGIEKRPVDINDANQVLFDDEIWQSGAIVSLPRDSGVQLIAQDLSDSGHITGFYGDSVSNHAFLFDGDSLSLLTAPPWFGSLGYLTNNAGDVVGSGGRTGVYSRVLLWSEGSTVDIASMLGDDRLAPIDLNDRGDVLFGWVEGQETVALVEGRSFVYRNGAVEDLGLLEGTVATIARDMNNSGQVVGNSYTADGLPIPFLWENGTIRAISFRRP